LRTRPPAPFVAAIVAIESDECARGGGRSPRGSLRFSFRPRGMRRRRVYGRRACIVDVDRSTIESLVAQRYLAPNKRTDNAAIGEALSKWLRVQRQYGGGA
jgi:hypothetical protein